MDPRFKLNYVSEDNMGSIQARLTSEMATTVVEMGPPEMAETHGGDDTEGAGAPKKKKTLGSFFKATEGTAPGPQSQASELQSYLQATILDSEEEPLDWWREHRKLFPRLSHLARKYLCIPATSAPSERVFSTGGNVVTCHSASLKPDHVNRLKFLPKNL